MQGASRRDDFNTQLIQSSSQQRPQYSSHAVRQAQTPVGSIAYSQPVLDLVEQFLMQDHGMEMSQAGPNICECQAELRNAETQRLQPRAYSSQDNMVSRSLKLFSKRDSDLSRSNVLFVMDTATQNVMATLALHLRLWYAIAASRSTSQNKNHNLKKFKGCVSRDEFCIISLRIDPSRL